MKLVWLALLLAGCAATPDVPPARASRRPPAPPAPPPADAAVATADATAEVPAPTANEEWLRGSTHVHAKPSGDATLPIPDVIEWYVKHHYDFIVLTDHNRVSVAASDKLIVIPGTELTNNPQRCEPPGDGTCRIHINALGVTARPEGKIEWTDHSLHARTDLYARAFAEARSLGAAIIQVNHPNWHWGMTPELLTQLGTAGAALVEIANSQFTKWNAGDQDHPSVESEWDAALKAGVKLWGVASDDAHDYEPTGGGKYPAGGGWVVVRARRDPQAILAALAAGRFYSSTGVTLTRAEIDHDELVIEVSPDTNRTYKIAFVENGSVVVTVNGLSGRRQLPQTGYVRAVVTSDDGMKAWVQPVRR